MIVGHFDVSVQVGDRVLEVGAEDGSFPEASAALNLWRFLLSCHPVKHTQMLTMTAQNVSHHYHCKHQLNADSLCIPDSNVSAARLPAEVHSHSSDGHHASVFHKQLCIQIIC